MAEINAALVLVELYERHKHPLHERIYHDLRFLLNGIKIITRIQSDDVRFIVKSLNTRYLREQFHGKQHIDCNSMHYLFSIIWHFRHCSNMDDVVTASNNRHFISKFRQQLHGTGIAVQYELYGLTEG